MELSHGVVFAEVMSHSITIKERFLEETRKKHFQKNA